MGEIVNEKWSSKKIRETFIKFYIEKKNHKYYKSSSVIPKNDPSLLFINAGMNQFKSIFLGINEDEELSKLDKVVNSQKCIRAGGKHNDLDDVGKDVYHHTFFEMLGNWSFGDYFKEEAIDYAWELLIEEYKISQDQIYVTYFGGDESQGLEPDNETKQIWMKYLPEDRILPFGCKDNFWEMGYTGPCGPCTEIHYDRKGKRDGTEYVNKDNADVIELWNIVFIQYNRELNRILTDLPNKHVDTGMGLERLASILQEKESNYDTDIFMPIIKSIQNITGCREYTGKVGKDDVDNIDTAYRIVADHIRTLTISLSDGVIPSPKGIGYVLRRILRRAIRYGYEILRGELGMLTNLVPIVCELFSEIFPELKENEKLIQDIIYNEELSFSKTLGKGIKYLNKIIDNINKNNKDKIISGRDAHFLFSTMGFPIDLTEIMALEKGIKIDKDEFNNLMNNEKLISLNSQKFKK